MVGNKSDLEAQRDVTYEEAKQFADENGKLQQSMHHYLIRLVKFCGCYNDR